MSAWDTRCSLCGEYARLPIDSRDELPVDWITVEITTSQKVISKVLCPAHTTAVMTVLGEWNMGGLGISHLRR